jgi:hypothetical protein
VEVAVEDGVGIRIVVAPVESAVRVGPWG